MREMLRTQCLTIVVLIVMLCGVQSFIQHSLFAHAATIEELQKNIDAKTAAIEALNKEIKQLDGQIIETSKQGQTLQTTIKGLDTSGAKLSKEIQVTQTKIGATGSTIEQLGLQITEKNRDIEKNRDALAQTVRNVNYADTTTLVESVLTHESLATLWNDMAALDQFQSSVRSRVTNLQKLTDELADKKTQADLQKKELEGLKRELAAQKTVIDSAKKEKAVLLSETKNKESEYRKQLAEKKRLAEAFSDELNAYEAQLQLIIDPSSYPHAGKGLLFWPLDNVQITQYFGNTEFAQRTAAYNGKGHNGIDFRASRGTRVKAALTGTVTGTGNSDLVPGCYSYGKWVLLQHNNGLSTLYAHLDVISVSAGQEVRTGDVIGYSGNTGYTTGPHLHFGVYVTQGVKIVKYGNSRSCKNAIIPVADLKAYLNPLEYL